MDSRGSEPPPIPRNQEQDIRDGYEQGEGFATPSKQTGDVAETRDTESTAAERIISREGLPEEEILRDVEPIRSSVELDLENEESLFDSGMPVFHSEAQRSSESSHSESESGGVSEESTACTVSESQENSTEEHGEIPIIAAEDPTPSRLEEDTLEDSYCLATRDSEGDPRDWNPDCS